MKYMEKWDKILFLYRGFLEGIR